MTSEEELARITQENFIPKLAGAVPELAPLIDDHLQFSEGEPFLHLLLPEVLKFCAAAFADGRKEVFARVMRFVDDSFAQGDDYVENAIAVSFVEDVGAFEGETPKFIAAWPAGLSEELRRQQAWRPEHQ